MFKFIRKSRRGPASGLLLVSSGGIGDTILLSTILERFTKVALSDERVSIVLPAESVKVAFLFNKTIQTLFVDYTIFRSSWSYRKKVARQFYESNFRCVISTDFLRHPNLDEMLIRYCEAEEVFAMRARPWQKYDGTLLKNHELYDRIYNSGPVHLDKILRWSNFANWLNGTNLPPPNVSLPDGQIQAARDFLRPTIVLAPFSAVKEKQSSPDVFISIVEYLRNDYEYNFIVVGTSGDVDANPEYLNLIKTPNTTFDASSFEELAPKLMKATLVVSVDTAVMHLSASLGTPTVCLASAAYVNEIVPYAQEITPNNVRFVFQTMECQGCLGSCHLPRENGRFPCVTRIKSEHILKAIDQLMPN